MRIQLISWICCTLASTKLSCHFNTMFMASCINLFSTTLQVQLLGLVSSQSSSCSCSKYLYQNFSLQWLAPQLPSCSDALACAFKLSCWYAGNSCHGSWIETFHLDQIFEIWLIQMIDNTLSNNNAGGLNVVAPIVENHHRLPRFFCLFIVL